MASTGGQPPPDHPMGGPNPSDNSGGRKSPMCLTTRQKGKQCTDCAFRDKLTDDEVCQLSSFPSPPPVDGTSEAPSNWVAHLGYRCIVCTDPSCTTCLAYGQHCMQGYMDPQMGPIDRRMAAILHPELPRYAERIQKERIIVTETARIHVDGMAVFDIWKGGRGASGTAFAARVADRVDLGLTELRNAITKMGAGVGIDENEVQRVETESTGVGVIENRCRGGIATNIEGKGKDKASARPRPKPKHKSSSFKPFNTFALPSNPLIMVLPISPPPPPPSSTKSLT
ncbi:hypothetical protein IMY05_C4665000200 [Salix suchowensis]|nr:hypothetical protein IMY05_C4665000200 [Salix suchowensis]